MFVSARLRMLSERLLHFFFMLSIFVSYVLVILTKSYEICSLFIQDVFTSVNFRKNIDYYEYYRKNIVNFSFNIGYYEYHTRKFV